MTFSERAGLVVVVVIVLTAGCVSGETDPRQGTGHIGMDVGYYQNDTFVVDGTVNFDLAIEEGVEFRQVMLCMYDHEGNLLNSTALGTFVTPSDSAVVEIEAERRPKYVVVDHPKFQEYPEFGTAVVIWTDDSIREEIGDPVTIIDDFRYSRPSEPGVCWQTG